jgi:hypothetical protein
MPEGSINAEIAQPPKPEIPSSEPLSSKEGVLRKAGRILAASLTGRFDKLVSTGSSKPAEVVLRELADQKTK